VVRMAPPPERMYGTIAARSEGGHGIEDDDRGVAGGIEALDPRRGHVAPGGKRQPRVHHPSPLLEGGRDEFALPAHSPQEEQASEAKGIGCRRPRGEGACPRPHPRRPGSNQERCAGRAGRQGIQGTERVLEGN
jgi:hypothetical protein